MYYYLKSFTQWNSTDNFVGTGVSYSVESFGIQYGILNISTIGMLQGYTTDATVSTGRKFANWFYIFEVLE